MAGFSTASNQHLIRSQLWSTQIKKVLEDELMGIKYVNMITDFPDGDLINIPSLGQAEAYDYAEGQAIRYNAIDTGNYQFSINEYKAAGTYIYKKFAQDSMYTSQVEASFVPSQARAIAVHMETDLLETGPNAQTASNFNLINGGRHRFVGSGTNEVLTLEDLARVRYGLRKANVPMQNLVGIVDPSVTHELATQANVLNLLTTQPQWGSIVNEGAMSGMTFKFSIYGFDLYESNHLKVNGGSETIGGVTAAAGVNNLFFSATPDVLPFVGLIRQPVTVESEYNKDFQRDEYVTTTRYGFGLYRPENLVVVLTDTDQVYA